LIKNPLYTLYKISNLDLLKIKDFPFIYWFSNSFRKKFENELFKNECFPQHKPKTKFQGYTECFNPIKINYE
jgi:hypothetical protein